MEKKPLSDVVLWIDDIFNHHFFEHLVNWNYWLWEHTSYNFCLWVCEHFEYFDGEK
jgi:hypothetical protein